MQTLTLEQLRTAVKTGGISAVSLQAKGGEFFLHVKTKGRADAVLARARSTEPRGFSNLMLAMKELHNLGIDAGTFDLTEWKPEQKRAVRVRPDRAAAMKRAREAMEHDEWFRAQVEQGLADANDPTTPWVSHADAKVSWTKKRTELLKRAKKA
jgi:hypothetical protein